jgi:site-specific recombinase XerD
MALGARGRRHQDQEVASDACPACLCVVALRCQRELQADDRCRAGEKWQDHGLVFASKVGTELLAGNVRRSLRIVLERAGLTSDDWVPHELRHSFVSLLSDHGVSLEQIADLVGHAGTSVTEKVYRHQLRPVLLSGAVAMDRIFPARPPESGTVDTQLDAQV